MPRGNPGKPRAPRGQGKRPYIAKVRNPPRVPGIRSDGFSFPPEQLNRILPQIHQWQLEDKTREVVLDFRPHYIRKNVIRINFLTAEVRDSFAERFGGQTQTECIT